MLILNSHGCTEVVNGEFQEKNYTILVDGQMYKVKGKTKKGSLILEKANGFTVPVHTPGSALAQFAAQAHAANAAPSQAQNTSRIQTLGNLLTNQISLDWSKLNLKVQQYMYFQKDGTPTTGLERNDLARTLCSFVGVSDACAWNWSKTNAAKPHHKNLVGIAQFFAKLGR